MKYNTPTSKGLTEWMKAYSTDFLSDESQQEAQNFQNFFGSGIKLGLDLMNFEPSGVNY